MKTTPSVVVCEDDSFLREMLSCHLRSEGFMIYEAENGFECLHHVVQAGPDVILLDMEMPRMNGFTLLKQLKESGIKTPIFVLSALHLASQLSELKEYGVKDFIQKPYSLTKISWLLNNL